MKVKVAIDFTDKERQLLAEYYEKTMSRDELRRWVEELVRLVLKQFTEADG